MFSSSANYNKLKTNLRLTINRLKLLEKKKTEMAQKARKEIGDYISSGKEDRARIRVEHIVREDYLVEAMELLEMYCDLLLARFGLIQTQKELDPGLEEAIASVLWATPRLQADIQEFKAIYDQFSAKYGKEFATACRSNMLNNVNEKVMHKLGVQAPPKILVERYMIEIAKSYNIPFEPDPAVMSQDEIYAAENLLLDFDFSNEKKGGGCGGSGGMSQPMKPAETYPPHQTQSAEKMPPPLPSQPPSGPSAYPGPGPVYPPPGAASAYPPLMGYPYPYDQGFTANRGPMNIPPNSPAPAYDDVIKEKPPASNSYPHPSQSSKGGPPSAPADIGFPELPSVPTDTLPHNSVGGTSAGGEDVDFDDLTRRFEELKKRK